MITTFAVEEINERVSCQNHQVLEIKTPLPLDLIKKMANGIFKKTFLMLIMFEPKPVRVQNDPLKSNRFAFTLT
jgi:hypothetical protein